MSSDGVFEDKILFIHCEDVFEKLKQKQNTTKREEKLLARESILVSFFLLCLR